MVVMVFLAGLVAGGLLNALAEKSAAAYGCGQITETGNPFEEVKRLWLGRVARAENVKLCSVQSLPACTDAERP